MEKATTAGKQEDEEGKEVRVEESGERTDDIGRSLDGLAGFLDRPGQDQDHQRIGKARNAACPGLADFH